MNAAPGHAVQASAVYEGWVRHRRFRPRQHAFEYRVAMLYLDLGELERVFRGRPLWSLDRPNVASFRRRDYMAPHDRPLDEVVRDRVHDATGQRPDGAVRLLTHLRYLGHSFNPVSFYYCHDADGSLRAVVAEITNTPWKQRHAYVLPVETAAQRGHALAWDVDKAFHVSPFMPMDCAYDWRLTEPGEALRVHMNVLHAGHRHFDATMVLQRRALDAAALRRVLWRYPAMTVKVVTAIHWEALKLWLKRTPVFDHPGNRGS